MSKLLALAASPLCSAAEDALVGNLRVEQPVKGGHALKNLSRPGRQQRTDKPRRLSCLTAQPSFVIKRMSPSDFNSSKKLFTSVTLTEQAAREAASSAMVALCGTARTHVRRQRRRLPSPTQPRGVQQRERARALGVGPALPRRAHAATGAPSLALRPESHCSGAAHSAA